MRLCRVRVVRRDLGLAIVMAVKAQETPRNESVHRERASRGNIAHAPAATFVPMSVSWSMPESNWVPPCRAPRRPHGTRAVAGLRSVSAKRNT